MNNIVWVDITQNGRTTSFRVQRALAKTLVKLGLEAKRTGQAQGAGTPIQLENKEMVTLDALQPNCEIVVQEIEPVDFKS